MKKLSRNSQKKLSENSEENSQDNGLMLFNDPMFPAEDKNE